MTSSLSNIRIQLRLCYIPGKKNPVVDALSWIDFDAVPIGLNCDVLADAQQKNLEIQACRTSITNLQWQDVTYNQEGYMILCASALAAHVCLISSMVPLTLFPFLMFHGQTIEAEVHLARHHQRREMLGKGVHVLSIKQSDQAHRIRHC